MRFRWLLAFGLVAACSGTATGTGTSGSSSSGNVSQGGGDTSVGGDPQSGADGGASSVYCTQLTGQCTCFSRQAANDIRCSTTVLPGAQCCADTAWPSQGGCACSLPCTGQRNNCMCQGVGGSEATCEGDVCCKDADTCECQSSSFGTSCTGGKTKVSSCAGFQPACRSGRVPVSSCSAKP